MSPCTDCGELLMLPSGYYGEIAEHVYLCIDCLVKRANGLAAMRAENERLKAEVVELKQQIEDDKLEAWSNAERSEY